MFRLDISKIFVQQLKTTTMQKVLLTFALVLSSLVCSYAQQNNAHTITINISGMKSDEGDVFVAMYNSEKDFIKNEYRTVIVKVSNKKAIAVFKNVPTAWYAITIFHDVNDNRKMDTNFIGIPKEPIGVSNNATGFMGPPKYRKAKFEVTNDVTISIKVK